MYLLKVLRQWRRCPREAGEDPGHEAVAGGAGGLHLGGLVRHMYIVHCTTARMVRHMYNCWDGDTHVQLMAGQHAYNTADCSYRKVL